MAIKKIRKSKHTQKRKFIIPRDSFVPVICEQALLVSVEFQRLEQSIQTALYLWLFHHKSGKKWIKCFFLTSK